MEQARQTFHHLLDSATVAELSQPSNGTKWTNGQLLFHMLLGYLIVVRLLVPYGSSADCPTVSAEYSQARSRPQPGRSTPSTTSDR
jgi:hypothetical protein